MEKSIEELRDANLELEGLKARKEAIKKAALEHRDSITDIELDESKKQVVELNNEIKAVEERIATLQKQNQNKRGETKMELNNNEEMDKRSTIEYRKAFMEYIQRGVKSDVLEFRADSFTKTSDAATVIPTTVLNEIIKESKISGNILSKVRKLNVKGALKVPTITLMPTASWIDEDTPSDRKKVTTGSVVFNYYGLEIKIAQSLLSSYVSIDAFEKELVQLAVEAMTNAKEIAIFNGSGNGQPTGIFTDTEVAPATITAANLVKYDKLVEALGKLKPGYRTKAEIAMGPGTWDKIVGMVDANGQPIARVNYGLNGATMSLLGYPVNIVEEDRIKSVENATAGTDYIMVIGQFNKYAINSNGELSVFKYTDHDNNQEVTKALEFLDGKVLDKNAFVKVKLGA